MTPVRFRVVPNSYNGKGCMTVVITWPDGSTVRCVLRIEEWSRALAKIGTEVEAHVEPTNGGKDAA